MRATRTSKPCVSIRSPCPAAWKSARDACRYRTTQGKLCPSTSVVRTSSHSDGETMDITPVEVLGGLAPQLSSDRM